MWRLLLAVGLLLTAVVSDSHAGYWVVRVLIGGGGGPAEGPGPGGPPGPGVRPLPRGGEGRGEGAVGRPPPGPIAPPPAPGGMPEAAPGDPTRSVVVVVPFVKHPNPKLTNPGKRDFYSKDFKPPGTWNVVWKLGLTHQFGYTNFLEASPIERYGDFSDKPAA